MSYAEDRIDAIIDGAVNFGNPPKIKKDEVVGGERLQLLHAFTYVSSQDIQKAVRKKLKAGVAPQKEYAKAVHDLSTAPYELSAKQRRLLIYYLAG